MLDGSRRESAATPVHIMRLRRRPRRSLRKLLVPRVPNDRGNTTAAPTAHSTVADAAATVELKTPAAVMLRPSLTVLPEPPMLDGCRRKSAAPPVRIIMWLRRRPRRTLQKLLL